MKIGTIRSFQQCCKVAIVATICCFTWLGLQTFILPKVPLGAVLVGALAGFAAVGVCVGVIASAKCPVCMKPFIGSTDEDGEPAASLFASCCKYCGSKCEASE